MRARWSILVNIHSIYRQLGNSTASLVANANRCVEYALEEHNEASLRVSVQWLGLRENVVKSMLQWMEYA